MAALVVACGAQLMVVLDGLVVNVALPEVGVDLHTPPSELQWVVTAYLVAFGGLMLLFSAAADSIGHRRVFLSGVAVFTLSSIVGGVALDPAVLISARLMQGVGAAALAPTSLSLITSAYSGSHLSRALSIRSATSSSAGALGLVLGGVITGALGWRWVLLINAPVGLLLWIIGVVTLAPVQGRATRALDVPGAATVTVGIGALTYGVSRAESHGWASPYVLVPLAVAAACLGLFVRAEKRSSKPLVPLSILCRRGIVVANVVIAVVGAIMTATMYFLSLYLQQSLGASPLRTGLALVPMSIVLTLGAFASRSLLGALGIRRLMIAGGILMAVGLLWLTAVSMYGGSVLTVVGPTLVWAAGASVVIMPCVALATAGVDAEYRGLASGLVNTARGTGGAVGLAALTYVAAVVTADSGGGDSVERLVRGYSGALMVSAGLGLVVAVLALAARGGVKDLAATRSAERD